MFIALFMKYVSVKKIVAIYSVLSLHYIIFFHGTYLWTILDSQVLQVKIVLVEVVEVSGRPEMASLFCRGRGSAKKWRKGIGGEEGVSNIE